MKLLQIAVWSACLHPANAVPHSNSSLHFLQQKGGDSHKPTTDKCQANSSLKRGDLGNPMTIPESRNGELGGKCYPCMPYCPWRMCCNPIPGAICGCNPFMCVIGNPCQCYVPPPVPRPTPPPMPPLDVRRRRTSSSTTTLAPTTTTASTTSTTCKKVAQSCKKRNDCCPDEHCIGDDEKICCPRDEGQPPGVPAPEFVIALRIPMKMDAADFQYEDCTGIVSGGQYVFTAAHCFKDWCGAHRVAEAPPKRGNIACSKYTTIDSGSSPAYVHKLGREDQHYNIRYVTVNPKHDVAVVKLDRAMSVAQQPCLRYTAKLSKCNSVMVFPARAAFRSIQYQYTADQFIASFLNAIPDVYSVHQLQQDTDIELALINGDSGGPAFTMEAWARGEVHATITGGTPDGHGYLFNLQKVSEGASVWWARYVKLHFSTCAK
eukprot:TRINITY_DN25467_c0_g4_i1.p1 TRINITY_DN25467_c0_g4~~TRINITY_DN25467_c0_g4_i1.p1  ORF type:complete len:433 (+),score=42.46 TRINITY_DN25467_c0_g4_i1:67-1365(+)